LILVVGSLTLGGCSSEQKAEKAGGAKPWQEQKMEAGNGTVAKPGGAQELSVNPNAGIAPAAGSKLGGQ